MIKEFKKVVRKLREPKSLSWLIVVILLAIITNPVLAQDWPFGPSFLDIVPVSPINQYIGYKIVSGMGEEFTAKYLTNLAETYPGRVYIKPYRGPYEGETVEVLPEYKPYGDMDIRWKLAHPWPWIWGDYYVKIRRVNGEEDWCNVNKDWDKVIWVPRTFEQSKTTISNLSHNPDMPHTFEERGMRRPPKVSELPKLYLEAASVRAFWANGRGLTDRKLELIWEEAQKTAIYKKGSYPFGEEDKIGDLGFKIDPFILLAILGAEGTGSFDTNNSLPDDDFIRDLAKAGNLLRQLIKAWIDNGKPGDWLHWVWRGNAGSKFIGGYAEGEEWYRNVRSMYDYRLQYNEDELRRLMADRR
ncbi:MAG: hypothetical protein NC818_03850 [Candidatus Omnitrophica bacterium]|nr:hypothetical protein [Candidatus Omnitrophota bacterium]